MYYFRNITKIYSDRRLLDGVTFMIGKRDRIGLVGRNGAGKSTLLKIISGDISSDDGAVELPSGTTIGFLRQELNYSPNTSVVDETKSAFKEINAIHDEIDELNRQLAEREDYESKGFLELTERLSDLTTKIALLGGDNLDAQTSKILKGLGFSDAELLKDINTFSGGWQMRVELAKLLLTTPDLLLLDEPNNHLDIESIIWLEEYLKDYPGIVILISHDTEFLNNICNRIIEIEFGKINDFKGNYQKYRIEKAERQEVLESAYVNQQKVIAQKERTINRFMAKATKTKLAQSMQKQLDKMERVEIPQHDTKDMVLRFYPPPRSGNDVLDITNISKNFGEKQVLTDANLKMVRGDKIAFVGQNGQGKSTLAKIITHVIDPSSGQCKIGTNVNIGYYAQDQTETLDAKKTVLETAEDEAPEEMRTKVRGILGSLLFSGEDVDKKVSVLSGGERARLALACMVMHDTNLLVMDEPTNHLDIQAKFILKKALEEFEGTLIVVSHDREFLRGLTDKVIEFKDQKLKEYLGDIDYFLDKRKMDDMRKVELSYDNKSSQKPTDTKPNLSFEEQKIVKNKVRSVEKKIEKLESSIAKMEAKLMDPEFYKSAEFDEVNRKYQSDKNTLDQLNQEWEELVDQM
jgi:ATP-binding cassette subfamily F protein 3